MKICRVEDLKGNEILGKPVMTSDFQILLATGTVLKPEYIEKLKEFEITVVSLKEEGPGAEAIEILKSEVEERFTEKVKDSGVIVKSLSLTNHDFSDEYNKAIEAKKVAEQGALKAKYDLERVTLEAEAQLKKQKSLNSMVLQEKAIDKWDGKMPQYFSGKELPFIVQSH